MGPRNQSTKPNRSSTPKANPFFVKIHTDLFSYPFNIKTSGKCTKRPKVRAYFKESNILVSILKNGRCFNENFQKIINQIKSVMVLTGFMVGLHNF